MNRKVIAVTILTLFVGVMLGMHYYVFSRMLYSLSVEPGMLFIPSIFLLTLLFPLANFIERTIDHTRWLYILSASWLGCIFILFFATLITEPLRMYISDENVTMLILIASAALIAYALVNGSKLRIKEVNIHINGLTKEMTVVHLSDIHLGAVHNRELAEKLTEQVNEINPDMVFLTGDLSDDSGDFSPNTIEPLDSIHAPIFYVTGNHENYLGLKHVMSVVKKTKIKILRNEVIKHDGLQIAGLDYPLEGFSTVESDMQKIKLGKEPAILLFHAPQYLDAARKAGFDAMFCGHVHGGQIFPFNLAVRLLFAYSRGLHDFHGMKVMVSMGVSTWGPPMRLGSSNEIVVAHLQKA